MLKYTKPVQLTFLLAYIPIGIHCVFVYKNKGNEDPFVVICKNQTCSNKISGINEINAYLRDHKITHDSK